MTVSGDFYEVLGVPRDADTKAIKNAFRQLARRYHPDTSTEPDAEQRFKQIAEAYGVLMPIRFCPGPVLACGVWSDWVSR